ncbi:MAG: ABC transporter substrate-binding protein [Anaerolineales bacterium]|nr:ABC transporter substrate-binding protein [Anaerolineales bacterium]
MKRILVGTIGILLLAACSPSAGEKSTPTPDQWPLEEIRLPMGYIPNVQFAPFYVAVEKGYFQEEGIKVEFDYKFETDGVALVGAGELPFAVVSGEQVLLARAQGLPVVYAMAWWRDYPVAVAALEETGIRTMEDLKGKKVGIPILAGASYVGYRALLNAAGIAEEEIALEVVGYNQVEALVAGQVDAAVVYANNEPVQLAARGYAVNVIRVADFVDLASNGLLTNEKTLAGRSELVRGMIRAILRAVEDTVADPEEAYGICRKYIEGLAEDDPIQKQVLDETIAFWKGDQPGWSDLAAWQNMEDTLQSMGLLTEDIDVTLAFTNDYLPG